MTMTKENEKQEKIGKNRKKTVGEGEGSAQEEKTPKEWKIQQIQLISQEGYTCIENVF